MLPTRRHRIFLMLCLLLALAGVFPALTHAFIMSDPASRIEVGDIDIAPTNTPIPPRRATPTPTPRIVPDVVIPSSIRQEAAAQKQFFTFSVSTTMVDFGTIDPTHPVIRTHIISLDPGSAQTYMLFGYQNHQLQIKDEDTFIPDTSCDDGTCTESIASLWENTLTYGFGFRCDEDTVEHPSCMPAFSNSNAFIQFADLSRGEIGTRILQGANGEKPIETRLTYKVNVPGTQKDGTYGNTLVFIAAPGI